MKAELFFKHPAGIAAAAIGSTLLWGSAIPMIKVGYALMDIAPGDMLKQVLFAGYRFTLGGLMILFLMVLLGQSLAIVPKSIGMVCAIGGVQTFMQYVVFYIGLSSSTGTFGSIAAGAISFFQLLLAHFLLKGDRLNARKLTGMLLGFLGLVLLSMKGGGALLHFGAGELLLLIAAFCAACGNILSKLGSQRLSVFYMNGYQMLLGGIGLTVVGLFNGHWMPFELSAAGIAILVYLAFVSAAGFVLWNLVLKYNSVGSISMFLFFIPVFGVLWSMLLLDEKLSYTVILSLGLVSTGIILINRTRQTAAATKEQ